MYQLKEYVNYGELGVCQITAVGPQPELNPTQLYYTIKPLEHPENTIYLPAEKADQSSSIRRIVSAQTALHLLEEELPGLEIIEERNRKEKQTALEKAMKAHTCIEWCRILKTLYSSRVQASASARKKSTTEELLWKTAEECLAGELSFTLGESKEDIKKRIWDRLKASCGDVSSSGERPAML